MMWTGNVQDTGRHDELLILSPYMQAEFAPNDSGALEVVLRNPLRRRILVIAPGIAHLLMAATTAKTRRELAGELVARGVHDPDDALRIIGDLVRVGVLTPEGDPRPEHRLWFERGWRHALMFYLSGLDEGYVEDECEDDAVAAEELFREYRKAGPPPPSYRQDLPVAVRLPQPQPVSVPLGRALLSRRTTRAFQRHVTPSLDEISTMLYWMCQPANETRCFAQRHLEEMPVLAGMSSYMTIEVYVVLQDTTVPDGIYHYDMGQHGLAPVREGRFAEELRTVAIGQVYDQLGCGVVLTALCERHMWRYRYSRALHKTFIEAGCLCQRLLTVACAIGWQSFLTPAVRDTRAVRLLCLGDGWREWPMYTVGIGKAADCIRQG